MDQNRNPKACEALEGKLNDGDCGVLACRVFDGNPVDGVVLDSRDLSILVYIKDELGNHQ